jgi:hypothetical protein
MDGDLFLLLLALVGGLAFGLGGCIGAEITLSVFREQDKQRALERRALNEIWRMVRDEFGIDKAPWMAAVLDRERREKRSMLRRVRERRRLLP